MTGMATSDVQFEPVSGFAILEPGATGAIDVTFRPAAPGDLTGLLTLGFNAPAEKRIVISLTGNAD
jgi:hypothetical protein